jgi:hypothetical protein
MEKKKVIELIKLEVLDCLSDSDAESLKLAKEVDPDFPWKELGDYQNLVALLPVALNIEFPVSELKDKVALKLYNMRDEIKAKVEAKKKIEEPPAPVAEEFVSDEEIVVDEVNVLPPEEEKFHPAVTEKIEHKRPVEEVLSKPDLRTKVSFDKDLVEKTVKEYLKSHFAGELESLNKNVKTTRLLSIILFVITLILIAALYFIK